MAGDSSYPVFSVFAFLAFVLVLIPLPWHFQAWNSGTCLFIIWTAVGCLNMFINSIIWHGNAINWAPVWCDISSRLSVGIAVALPAASLCINRRLYKIASVQTVTISREEKRRAVIIDLFIGLGIPIVQMALQYIVEGHRFNIFEDVGCYPAFFNTPIAYPLSFVWPTVIGLVSAVYCILTLRTFMKRRAQFSQFLTSNSALTVNRYFRLMALATVEILFDTPITAYGIYLNIVANPMYPWKGWADAHFDYSAVDLFPSVLWRANPHTVVSLELSRWLLVFCGFVFFGFFGFADEARRHYRMAYWAVAKRFGKLPPPRASQASSGYKDAGRALPMSSTVSSLPIYVAQPSPSKRDSFGSSVAPTTPTGTSTWSLQQSPIIPDFKVDPNYPSPLPLSTSQSLPGNDDLESQHLRFST